MSALASLQRERREIQSDSPDDAVVAGIGVLLPAPDFASDRQIEVAVQELLKEIGSKGQQAKKE